MFSPDGPAGDDLLEALPQAEQRPAGRKCFMTLTLEAAAG
jgi:hypothetical protein